LNCLAIDTATETLGLCLRTETATLSISLRLGFNHCETLIPRVERLCVEGEIKASDIHLIVVSLGPGSFTGIRIGLAAAKGLALGACCDIVGVPSLDAHAWRFSGYPYAVVPVIDARKNRFYSAVYRLGKRDSQFYDLGSVALIERLLPAGKYGEPILLTGPDAPKISSMLAGHSRSKDFTLDPNHLSTDPYALLNCGMTIYKEKGCGSQTLIPLYLRKSEAELNLNRRE